MNKKVLIVPGLVLLIVWLFAISPDKPKEINIILSPHYDDAGLSLGGFICAQENKTPVLVVTFFSGLPPKVFSTEWDKMSNFPNDVVAVQKRQFENNQALKICGAEVHDLTFLDYQYRTALGSSVSLADLEDQIEKVMAQFPKAHLNLFGPAYFGEIITHPDHLLLHQAFLALALKYKGDLNKNFFVYEDFPYVLKFNRTFKVNLSAFLNETSSTTFSFTEKFLPLSSANLAQKLQVISDYQSQTTAFKKLNENILTEEKVYAEKRCLPNVSPCEVIFSLKSL